MVNLILLVIRKFILAFIVALLSFQIAKAQSSNSNFWSHVKYGGELGLNFGDSFFSATISPSAIYQFDDAFALGLGMNATFNNQKNFYKSTILGGSLIGLYNVIPEIQLSAEFEKLNVNRKYEANLNLPNDNYWYPALFIGAGYRTGNVAFGIRYDVLYNREKSIYSEAWAPFARFYF